MFKMIYFLNKVWVLHMAKYDQGKKTFILTY